MKRSAFPRTSLAARGMRTVQVRLFTRMVSPGEAAPSSDRDDALNPKSSFGSAKRIESKLGSTASSFSCVSLSSDRSKSTPMCFSKEYPNTSEDNGASQRKQDVPKVEHKRVQSNQDSGESDPVEEGRIRESEESLNFLRSKEQHELALGLEQSQCGLLAENQRQFLKHMYKRRIEGTQSIRVYLTEGLRGDLHQMEQPLTKQKSPQSSIDCTDLFSPGRGASVRTVLTTGPGGVGKSVLVQRSIVDWCEDRALQHIQLLCPLPFSQLNLLQQESCSLMELLQTFCPGLRESGLTDLSHYRLLFILDGLDQCRLPLDFSTKHKCCDAEAPMPVGVLLTNLMLGNLLPDAQLWITCRPTAARSIPPKLIHRVSEVRGFNSRQQEDYFLQDIQDEDQAEEH